LGVNLNEIQSRFPEYPTESLEMQERAAQMAHRLREDFGPLVVAKPVGLDSPRGLWLSLRRRLRNELSVVVNGKRVVPGSTAYEVLRQIVQEESGGSAWTQGQAGECGLPACGPTTCEPTAEAGEAKVDQAKSEEEPKKASSGWV
jgi:hypothetical protein